jgi:hypothetical protein
VNVSADSSAHSLGGSRSDSPLDFEIRVMIVNQSFARHVLASGTRSASASAS